MLMMMKTIMMIITMTMTVMMLATVLITSIPRTVRLSWLENAYSRPIF